MVNFESSRSLDRGHLRVVFLWFIEFEQGVLAKFYASMRKGRAKGESELRAVLHSQAKGGDAYACHEFLIREKEQGGE